MTASEFAFLALGLVLGIAVGAAIIQVLRSRPVAPPEVRVTMTPLTVPTRSVTLAGDPFDPAPASPAPGGPGDRRGVDRAPRGSAPDDLHAARPVLRPAFAAIGAAAGAPPLTSGVGGALRTAVRFTPSPVERGTARPGDSGSVASLDRQPIAVAVADAAPEAIADAAPVAAAVADREPVGIVTPGHASSDVPAAAPVGIAAADAPRVEILAASPDVAPAHGVSPSEPVRASAPAGPCAELRVIADDRCAVAGRARQAAELALAALRDAQRSYDDHSRRADEADGVADPRAMRAAKETAQQAFRAARERAGSREELEAAARTWLATINRINLDARDAAARATKARAAANELVTTLERLTAEADGARVAREVAEEACVAARQAVAECEEAETLAAAAAVAPAPLAAIEPATRFPEDEPELTEVGTGDREARIVRLLRGDRDALVRIVADLGGDDPAERRRWQLAITGLVDAITAQAIDASIVDVPDEPPFWSPFTRAQRREVVAALASLGYRFDGLGGFADGRVPSQRDLSLALGYAGLDPMRVRRWPTEAEARELLAEARVAAGEYLVGAAGGFTLSELIDLLGRRADGLTDLWNDWGRVRGRLLTVD